MSHKNLWLATTAIFIVAVAVLYARDKPGTGNARELPAADANGLAKQMFALLENDPRVRRTPTQRVVEALAALAEDPTADSAETRYALGLLLYYRERDSSAAETALREAIALRPEWSWPHNNLGSALFDLGREAEALESFGEAMKLDPEWPRPLNDMAILFRLEGRMVLALNQILAALEMDPEGAVTHYNYGVILEVMGRYSEARAQYERVIELDATIPASHYNIACHYARDGDLEAALPYLTEAIRLEEKFRKECEKDPDFDRVRDEAEFVALLEGTGITGSPRTTSP